MEHLRSMDLINTHFLKVHNFTLHPKPIIPIFSEIFFKLQPILRNVLNFLH